MSNVNEKAPSNENNTDAESGNKRKAEDVTEIGNEPDAQRTKLDEDFYDSVAEINEDAPVEEEEELKEYENILDEMQHDDKDKIEVEVEVEVEVQDVKSEGTIGRVNGGDAVSQDVSVKAEEVTKNPSVTDIVPSFNADLVTNIELKDEEKEDGEKKESTTVVNTTEAGVNGDDTEEFTEEQDVIQRHFGTFYLSVLHFQCIEMNVIT